MTEQEEIASLKEKLEKIYGSCADLIMANHALEDKAVLLMAGLIEIEKIKGNPPIQVARTIATRIINACKEQATNEPTIFSSIHGSPRNPEGTEECQA